MQSSDPCPVRQPIRPSRAHDSRKGITLVEIMVGLVVITVGFVTLSTVFTAISNSILINKRRSLATNLAQEKVESLKNLSYFKLLVTTAVADPDPNFSAAMYYDKGTTQSYYPQETLHVGGMTFARRVFVEFLRQDGNDFIGYPTVNWASNDTGIKRITVYVVWEEDGEWKKVELRNLKNNPDRAELEYSFSGTVSSAGTSNRIYNALVDTEQNPSFYARTDGDGTYSFKVQPGTYTLRVTATGYFTQISTGLYVPVGASGGYVKDINMYQRLTGTVTGYVFIRDHLVVTQVVASTHTSDSGGYEWVELYNPTTYSILIASRAGSTGEWNLIDTTVTYICQNNDEPPDNPGLGHPARHLIGIDPYLNFTFRSTSTHWTQNTSTIAVPPQTFFLIANASTITAVNGRLVNRIADAYYYDTAGYDPSSLVNVIKTGENGGIRVTGKRGYDFNGRTDWHDGIGWMSGGTSPTKAAEGSPFPNQPSPQGFVSRQMGTIYGAGGHDKWAVCEVGPCLPLRNSETPLANCWDTDNNLTATDGTNLGGDWYANTITHGVHGFIFSYPENLLFNADVSTPPSTGRPAVGASVSVNDGLSSVAFVQANGSFTVTEIATGSWVVAIASNAYYYEVSLASITPTITTSVPNNSTIPRWTYPYHNVAFTSYTLYGYVSGRVTDALQRPLSGVTVSAPGAQNALTNNNGRYRLYVEPAASVMVTAAKTGFATRYSGLMAITLGNEQTGVDFTMVNAGSIAGFVTTNGIASGKIAGVPVVATDINTTTVMGSAITDMNGNFNIPNISTGEYLVAPSLESGESSSPGVSYVYVKVTSATWSSTFTVANAFGEISGQVSEAGNAITTGVLLVASTQSITALNPPLVNSGVRGGSVIYYAATSDSSGRYSLPVRGGSDYYLYGWYGSVFDSASSTTTKKSASGNPFAVGANGSVTKDLAW